MTLALTKTPAATTGPEVRVLTDRCAGCQECVIRCPTGALSMDTLRWVARADASACVGCRQCVRTCPFSAIVVEGPLALAPRIDPPAVHPEHLLGDVGEIRSGFAGWPEALEEAARCLTCPDPTCVRGCPAHNDIPGFIAAIRRRDLEAAAGILRRTTVLPDVCSRVCNQASQCEGACTWSLAGGTPVAIGRLERFVSDQLPTAPPTPPTATLELSVGIVGSGPGGLGAAFELLEAGASVTVYERDETPGGLCIWGIPDFTLPDAVATRPWEQLVRAGVDLRCGSEIRPGDLDSLLEAHDALILAHGAGAPLRLKVPGCELDGVVDATTLLKGGKAALEDGGDPAALLASLGLPDGSADVPGRIPRVLVLGAGNTAMDVARTSRRLGLEALCVDWLDERFALARPDELAEARAEGVEVRFSRTLKALHGSSGRVAKAELARTAQVRRDRQPKVLETGTETVEIDLVVMAMGYRIDPAFVEALPSLPVRREVTGVPDRHWSASGILAGPASSFANHSPVGTLALGREVGLATAALPVEARTWVVGDARTGPATVVEAMAQGRRAAAAVLDARPARPGRGEAGAGAPRRRVLVCFESQGGHTAKAAAEIAAAFTAVGHSARCLPIARVGANELAAADLVIVGTWVEGLVVAKVRPARAMRAWLEGLPRLGGRPVALFCTYAVAPKSALGEMRRCLEAKGAIVASQAAFGPRELAAANDAFGPAAFGRELAGAAALGDQVPMHLG